MQENGRKLVFEWTNEHGEDGSFCLLAHEMGYKLGVCADVDIGHRITFTGRWDAEHEKGVMTDDDFGIEQLNKPEGV
jgi:hypothetical protein